MGELLEDDTMAEAEPPQHEEAKVTALVSSRTQCHFTAVYGMEGAPFAFKHRRFLTPSQARRRCATSSSWTGCTCC